MTRIWDMLCAPGAQKAFSSAAPTQCPTTSVTTTSSTSEGFDEKRTSEELSVNSIKGLNLKTKARLLDRWLDAVVRASGSTTMFGSVIVGLLIWGLLGIKFHGEVDWQVFISDAQAILSYIFDSLLMRQSLNTYEDNLDVTTQLQSRMTSHIRMLDAVNTAIADGTLVQGPPARPSDLELELPRESAFGRCVTTFSLYFGHIGTVGVYWVGVLVWLCFGPRNGWSNTWQLYMNSATSALMTFTFVFLANIRERHAKHARISTDAAFKLDGRLEQRLRHLTRDNIPNPTVTVPPQTCTLLQRAIYYYADVVGTLVGILLLAVVMVAWLAIGPVLGFDANWWLIIGTYAGLIGLHDGFVLLNVQAHLRDHEAAQYDRVAVLEQTLFATARRPTPVQVQLPENALSFKLSLRASTAVGRVCANAWAVVGDVVLIVGLLIGSSLMSWDTTGQLLSNVPPSIIESFLMIILLPGHNWADAARRNQLDNIYRNRLDLLAWLEGVHHVDDTLLATKKAPSVIVSSLSA
ncbi:hypothetical protein PYCC9005_002274 [Savitreella phatthalungensis]